MSAEPSSLRAGRQRYQATRHRARVREAKARVKAFERWKARGFATEHTPPALPTDADFRLARGGPGREAVKGGASGGVGEAR